MIDPSSAEHKQYLEKILKKLEAELLIKYPDDIKEYNKEFELTALQIMAELGRRDFFYFMDKILGSKGMSRELHGELADFMMQSDEAKLVLIPRGHLKSTICTVGYALWRIVRDPEIRILIANYKLDNAKAFLLQISLELKTNELLRACYPELIPDMKLVKWNETAVTVRRERKPKEATVEVAGVGTEITGRHYDLILKDDLVGPENITTKDQLDKLKAWDRQTLPILEPGGDQVYIGTRWHFDDLYGYLLEAKKDQIAVFHREVYKDLEGTQTIWPEKYSPERVKKIQRDMETDPKQGHAFFVAQYLNRVIDEASATFKRKFLKTYARKDIPPNLGLSITVDPAISDKQSADFCALTVRGVDEKNRWWVLQVVAKRGLGPTELVDLIFEVYQKWTARGYDVGAVAVEFIAYQKALQFLLRDEMFNRNVFLPLVELVNSGASKEYRIRGLVPRWEQGGILLPEEGEDDAESEALAVLQDQLFRFPKCAHDDIPDSLAMHDEISVVAGALPKPEGGVKRDRYGYPIKESAGGNSSHFL
jgi:phage terminase large subunit-like protein